MGKKWEMKWNSVCKKNESFICSLWNADDGSYGCIFYAQDFDRVQNECWKIWYQSLCRVYRMGEQKKKSFGSFEILPKDMTSVQVSEGKWIFSVAFACRLHRSWNCNTCAFIHRMHVKHIVSIWNQKQNRDRECERKQRAFGYGVVWRSFVLKCKWHETVDVKVIWCMPETMWLVTELCTFSESLWNRRNALLYLLVCNFAQVFLSNMFQ